MSEKTSLPYDQFDALEQDLQNLQVALDEQRSLIDSQKSLLDGAESSEIFSQDEFETLFSKLRDLRIDVETSRLESVTILKKMKEKISDLSSSNDPYALEFNNFIDAQLLVVSKQKIWLDKMSRCHKDFVLRPEMSIQILTTIKTALSEVDIRWQRASNVLREQTILIDKIRSTFEVADNTPQPIPAETSLTTHQATREVAQSETSLPWISRKGASFFERLRTSYRFILHWIRSKYIRLVIFLPSLLALLYFLLLASPMYISESSFAIRSADSTPSVSSDFASMFLKTGGKANDVYILTNYIESLDIAEDIDKDFALKAHYSDRSKDIISRLWKHATQDEWLTYWNNMVIPELDADTGIITLKVRAYTAEMAQKISQAIIKRSEVLVNAMNLRARQDAVTMAEQEVHRAEKRVRDAQAAMRDFRDTHNLLDPKATAAGVQSLVAKLEADASALRTQILETSSYMRESAPLLKSLRQRLAAVEKQLKIENQRVAGQSSKKDNNDGNLNALVAGYEDLTIEADFAQRQLVSAMSSLEQARIQQVAQSRYVVAYQQPTLPDEALYPRPILFTVYIFFGTVIVLGLASLIWASIREHAGF